MAWLQELSGWLGGKTGYEEEEESARTRVVRASVPKKANPLVRRCASFISGRPPSLMCRVWLNPSGLVLGAPPADDRRAPVDRTRAAIAVNTVVVVASLDSTGNRTRARRKRPGSLTRPPVPSPPVPARENPFAGPRRREPRGDGAPRGNGEHRARASRDPPRGRRWGTRSGRRRFIFPSRTTRLRARRDGEASTRTLFRDDGDRRDEMRRRGSWFVSSRLSSQDSSGGRIARGLGTARSRAWPAMDGATRVWPARAAVHRICAPFSPSRRWPRTRR